MLTTKHRPLIFSKNIKSCIYQMQKTSYKEFLIIIITEKIWMPRKAWTSEVPDLWSRSMSLFPLRYFVAVPLVCLPPAVSPAPGCVLHRLPWSPGLAGWASQTYAWTPGLCLQLRYQQNTWYDVFFLNKFLPDIILFKHSHNWLKVWKFFCK